MRRRENSIDMLNGPLAGKLVRFALPIALAGFLQQLFNSADAAVAGHFVGPQALAAIGGTTPVVMLLISLFTGLSIGTNVLVALRIGQGHPEKIGDAVHTSMAVALASGALLLAAGIAFTAPLLELIAMPEDAFGPAVTYLGIFFLGMPFSMVYNFGSAVLRSKGDTQRPLYALAVAVVLNVVLNVAFVTILPWGIAGVAVATDIASGVSAALVAWFLMHEEGPYRLRWRALRFTKAELLVILKIGVPAGLQGVVFSLSNVVIQSGINGFGSAATAGVAAALNFEFYTYFLINGFTQAAVTFVGQNYAAHQTARCDRIFGLCLAFGIASVLLMNAMWLSLGARALSLFTTDAASLEYGLVRMWWATSFQFVAATYEITAGAMRGMGWSMTPTLITVAGSCLLRIVWVLAIFPLLGSFEMLIVVYPISWVITGVAMFSAYYFVRRRAYAHLKY